MTTDERKRNVPSKDRLFFVPSTRLVYRIHQLSRFFLPFPFSICLLSILPLFGSLHPPSFLSFSQPFSPFFISLFLLLPAFFLRPPSSPLGEPYLRFIRPFRNHPMRESDKDDRVQRTTERTGCAESQADAPTVAHLFFFLFFYRCNLCCCCCWFCCCCSCYCNSCCRCLGLCLCCLPPSP